MLDSIDLERLQRIGFTPALRQQLAALALPADDDGATPMRVAEVQREGLTLHDGNGPCAARLLPALRLQLADEADALAVGDWVLAGRDAFGQWWVHTRIPPLNQLARRLHDGRDKVTRAVIVSNVDTALLVMGLDGDFNLGRLERYVTLVRMAGVEAVAVLTKADLCADPAARLRAVRQALPAVAAMSVNTLSDDVAQPLEPWLRAGRTLVLLGSSGTGKSTLTNALLGEPRQLTGANRAGDGRGRHTTTARSMHITAAGACIIDTPGLRTLRLDGDAEQLDAVFGDVQRLAAQCRFRDCRHGAEPGCAVREALPPERLRNYGKMLREARRDSVTALERKAEVARWKARGRAARGRIEAKRGE